MRTTVCTLVALAALVTGCTGPTMPAFGDTDDLVIIIDASASDALRAGLSSVFEAVDEWLVREPAFDVVFATPGELGDYTSWRNILFCGTWGAGEVADIVRDRVPGVPLTDEPTLTTSSDVWAGRQVVAAMMAGSESQLLSLLAAEGKELRSELTTDIRDRLITALCRDARSSGRLDALEDRFGWTICIPEDYELDTGAERDGFIMFDRLQPDRYVFISWRPGGPEDITRESMMEERNRLCALYHDGDTIQDRRPVLADTVLMADEPVLRLRGWWGNRELTGGGPFISYCLYAPDDGLIYLIDASLFAPGLDKTPLMRHLDAVLMTFRP